VGDWVTVEEGIGVLVGVLDGVKVIDGVGDGVIVGVGGSPKISKNPTRIQFSPTKIWT